MVKIVVEDECAFTDLLEKSCIGGRRNNVPRGRLRPRQKTRVGFSKSLAKCHTSCKRGKRGGNGNFKRNGRNQRKFSPPERARKSPTQASTEKADQDFVALKKADQTASDGGLVVGLRSVLRAIEKQDVHSIIFASKRAPEDFASVLENACEAIKVPLFCLEETTPERMGDFVGLPSATVIAFRKKTRPEFAAPISILDNM